MPNRTHERIERYNKWLAQAGQDTAGTLTRARTAWKSLPLERRNKVLHEIGFLCEDCNRQAQVGKTLCRKHEEKRAEKPKEEPKDGKTVAKTGKSLKDHAGHRPKGKKGKKRD